MKIHTITLFTLEPDITDILLEFLYKKKILKKILQRDDKFDPPFVIINSSLQKRDLNKILKRKFYNYYKLR